MKCVQGASALQKSIVKSGAARLRLFIVWEKVLETDWAAPSSSVLARLSDPRVVQFWDPGRVTSHNLGEKDFKTKVWDWISIYPPGTPWNDRLPAPAYSGRPVEDVIAPFEQALSAIR